MKKGSIKIYRYTTHAAKTHHVCSLRPHWLLFQAPILIGCYLIGCSLRPPLSLIAISGPQPSLVVISGSNHHWLLSHRLFSQSPASLVAISRPQPSLVISGSNPHWLLSPTPSLIGCPPPPSHRCHTLDPRAQKQDVMADVTHGPQTERQPNPINPGKNAAKIWANISGSTDSARCCLLDRNFAIHICRCKKFR